MAGNLLIYTLALNCPAGWPFTYLFSMQLYFSEGEQVTRSFISSFKPLLIALLIIGTIEGSIALHTGGRALFDSNFLELAFARAENPNKILLEIKKFYSSEFKPYFLQVGDSSGFHGMKAKLLKKVFPDKPYLVLSCCGDMGYAGIAMSPQRRLMNSKAFITSFIMCRLFPHPPILQAWDRILPTVTILLLSILGII